MVIMNVNEDFRIERYLPFSGSLSHSELLVHAQELVETLGLSATARLVEGNAQFALDHERRFRLGWWTNGEEPLRLGLQQSKLYIYRHSRTAQKEERLARAWKHAEKVIRSTPWRRHFLYLIQETDPVGESYFRLLFRAAQQVWSRAARWHAVMPASARSPFVPLVKLIAAGALPLGCHENSLWILLLDETIANTQDFGPLLTTPRSAHPKGYVFLSCLFSDSTLTAQWQKAFHENGWKTLHGPVNEDVAPPEAQLGKQIQEAQAVVGLLQRPDPDFGIPWWMYQELDYASFCRRPVILVCQSRNSEAALKDSQHLSCKIEHHWHPIDKHHIWHWLQDNTA